MISRNRSISEVWKTLIVIAVGFEVSIVTGAPADQAVTSLIAQCDSDTWTVRASGFYGIVEKGLKMERSSQFPIADGISAIVRVGEMSKPQLSSTMINLLDKETDLVESGRAPISESYSKYYGDLIQAVTTMRARESSKVLLRCINTGGMVINTLAGFGEDAFGSAMDLLSSSDEETRANILRLFANMAEPRNFEKPTNSDSKTALITALMDAAESELPYSRLIAIDGLRQFRSDQVTELLRRLAQNDPFSITENGTERYPVREAAAAAIR